ncbi:hypothetical protein HYT84_02450 [Candidatus Micrarchaeota archaeon]|nr:hypothetical protein [Candidatus Micrarchaeota archaeon]
MPEEADGKASGYKCEDRIIPETCTPCSDNNKEASCTFYYQDGSTTKTTYQLSKLTDLYADVISSLPSPDRCCLKDKGGANYTYFKVDASGRKDYPIVFSYAGDKNAKCGLPDLEEVQNYCGVELPVKNYKLECNVVDKYEFFNACFKYLGFSDLKSCEIACTKTKNEKMLEACKKYGISG